MSKFSSVVANINDPIVTYMKGYAQSRIEETKKIPKLVRLVKGILSKEEIDRSLVKSDMSEQPVWDRAVVSYTHTKYSVADSYARMVEALWQDDQEGFVEAVANRDYYLDSSFVEHLNNEYNGELQEVGYEMLDKFFISKVAEANDLDNMYNYMQNLFIGMVNGVHGRIIKDQINEVTSERSWKEGIYNDGFLGIVGLYIMYRYNDGVLKGNIYEDQIDPSIRFMQFLSNISCGFIENVSNVTMFSRMMFDICGIKDVVFINILREIVISLVSNTINHERVNKSVITEIGKSNSKYRENLSLLEISLNVKPLDYLQKKLREEEKSNKSNDRGFMSTLEKESLGITRSHYNARELMKVTANINTGIEYMAETMGITIMRTDAEKVNNLARKVDLVAIQFESMTNQWNKTDAVNYAWDVIGEIDDAMAKTTNKDTMIALQAIRSQLLQEMARGKEKDIRKMRTTINISYPKGYGG